MDNNSSMNSSDLTCLEGLNVMLAESASIPKYGAYEAVLGLGMPAIDYID